ncbi:PREDICTED: zinc finger protein 646-like isoform X1 [Cyprinodon variegatus]|uniref:zinc finger protein 646-like isoform X1 n=1 Tax=Cyprinodon variegatus TaxID=28743 RepID=UPI000742CDA2|nr:PREDICTED: zinc finger protein 646-like isoform X1 [Cyprinodon variegatus]XP_015237877.1 PREDICTED: zinc finger protein 646-like isoform X1 [Cyprinodon variegatus]
MAEQDRKGSLSCRQSAQNVQSEEEPRFKCNECGRGYRHAGSLSNHRRTHEVGLFQCSICGKENWNVSAMKNHLRSHSSFKKHSCADCGKSFRLATQLLKHERVHLAQRSEDHSYRNTWEEKSTHESESDQQPQLNEHSDAVGISIKNMPEGVYNSQSESCNDAVNRPFCCNLCNRSYIHQRSLINHNKTHQLGIFECTVCFKLCTNMGALYNHQRTHKAQGERDRTLTAGPLTNKTLDQFLPHSQDAPENFCQLCHTLFPNNMEFQEHIQMHKTSSQSLPEHMEIYKPSMASPESPVENAPPLSLTEHPSGFNQALNNTTNSHDKEPPIIGPQGGPSVIETSGVPSQNTNSTAKTEENPAAGSEERPFKCHTCGKSYRHSGSLINHKRSHQVGVYTCSVCCKNYPHLAALKSHLRLHRNQRPSFHHQAEQDWLSPEPLTPDRQQGCFYSLNEPKRPVFSIDQEKLADYSGAICEEQSNQDIACLPPPTPRHMCADCGETFADVADIRTHSCPFRSAAVHHVDALNQRTSENPEINLEFDGSHSHLEQENISTALLNGNRKDDYVDEDDDGDQYQCSVCGNSYSTMTDLRSHLQGHRLSCDAPQSSNEETKDDELGEMTICSACGETLLSRQDFITHHLLHMKGQADFLEDLTVKSSILESKEEACIICSSCGISCSNYHHLNSHGCAAAKTEESASCKEEIKVEDSSQQEEANLTIETGGDDDRQFKCDQCGRSYRHAGSLLNHKKSHKTGVFRCVICLKRFYNLLALKNHQRSHFDIKRHACHECGKAFKIQKQLLNHLRRHKENQGEIQDLSSQTQALMPSNGSRADERMPASDPDQDQKAEDQMRQTEGQAEKGKDENDKRPYSCDQCGRTYRHAGSLVNHRNSHKTGEYYCSICTNTYSNQLAMKNHLRSHFASKKHLCQKCGKGFRVKKQLLTHVCAEFRKKGALGRTGRRCRNFTCKTCKKAFLSVSQLMAHACDGSSDDRDSEQNASPGEEERPFRCNVCHRTYRHAGSLLNHKNTHKTGHFSCTFCSKPFTNLMALRSHTRIHTQKKKYACLTCGKAFRLASVLQNHQRVHSRALSHFSCASCGKSFQGSFGQRTHRCHRGQGVNRPSGVQEPKSFMCDLCGRSYRHAGSLLNHKKSHSEDLYPCTLCLQTFPDPLSLQLHSQVRRQCCPECGKTFCVSAHLQSHMKVHFKNRPVVCSLCLQSFPNTASYQEHHTLHHAAQGSHQQDMEDPAESNIYSHSGLNQSMETVLPRLEDNPDNTDLQTGESSLSEDKSHVCEHCGRTYRHPGSLLNHKNSHKTGCFFCSVCHKKFTNLMALKNHRRIHTEPKRYQCLTCGKAFRVSTQLLCHQRIHTKEKPFTCLLCSKSFSSKSNLRSHQKMHQNVPHGEADAFKDLDLGSPL